MSGGVGSGVNTSGQALWAADALWAGPELVVRLADQVPTLRQVLLIDELDMAASTFKQFPAALVLLHRDRLDGDPLRSKTLLTQDWIVALAVKSARQEANRNSAGIGPLIPQVVRALQGWAPGGQLRRLAWQPGMRPHYGRDISYWPLVFSLQVVTA